MGRPCSKVIDKEYLFQEYIVNQKTVKQIATELSCGTSIVRRAIAKHKIRKKSLSCDLTGKTFGRLVVVSKAETLRSKTRWNCQCVCGNKSIATDGKLKSGRTKSCGCNMNRTGIAHPNYNGTEHISGTYFNKTQNSARIRGLQFTVTKDYLEEVYRSQNNKCALTGLELSMPSSDRKIRSGNCNGSLDRIDSKLGYVPGNVQWIHKSVNIMKWNHSTERFIELCRLVVEHANKKEAHDNEQL